MTMIKMMFTDEKGNAGVEARGFAQSFLLRLTGLGLSV